MRTKSLGGRLYGLALINGHMAKSEIYFICRKRLVFDSVSEYKTRQEKIIGKLVVEIHLDDTSESSQY